MTTTIGTTPTTDTAGFVQTVFTVRLTPNLNDADANGDFTSYAHILGYSNMTDTNDPVGGNTAPGASITNIIPDSVIKKILTNNGNNGAVPEYFFAKGKCRDTSIGGNDAINCYPQFCENDDICDHPFLQVSDGEELSGMGRIYSEVYDDQQNIMYLTFGVPRYNSITAFYNDAILPQLASLQINGGVTTPGQIGMLIGEALGAAALVWAAITMPVIPLVFIYAALNRITDSRITKYYEFQSTMPLYYRVVNSMLIHLSVNMGITQDDFSILGENALTASGQTYDLTGMENQANAIANTGGTPTYGLPDIFQKNGFDIYRIIQKKYKYINAGLNITGADLGASSDYTLLNPPDGMGEDITVQNVATATSGSAIENFANNFITSFKDNLYDAALYIGFRIEKGVDTSESFSNETGQSSIAQQVNGAISSAADTKFTLEHGNISNGPISDAIQGAISAAGGILSGLGQVAGIGGYQQILAGNGMLDFPDVWKDSSFSKHYSFHMSLRSPYGDPISIFQNLYIPLAILLAGSLPRSVGQSAYTSPFICRAYCKGMFAVPMGMITSINIRRGADQFGWNTARLPTCIDVDFEIKDLSPAMYLAVGDGGFLSAINQVFSTNSTFQEYLMTLSGMGLAERITWIRQLRLKASYLLAITNTTKLSPFYWGAAFGNTVPAKILSQFLPATRLPDGTG